MECKYGWANDPQYIDIVPDSIFVDRASGASSCDELVHMTLLPFKLIKPARQWVLVHTLGGIASVAEFDFVLLMKQVWLMEPGPKFIPHSAACHIGTKYQPVESSQFAGQSRNTFDSEGSFGMFYLSLKAFISINRQKFSETTHR